MLLFVDATEIRGGLLGRDKGGALRLIFIALPISVVAATVVGAYLLPTASLAVLLMIACAVMPTDFSPMGALFDNNKVPSKIKHLLNVESGYNDGIVAPVFVFALAFAEGSGSETGLGSAFEAAVVSAGISLAVGVVVGLLVAGLANLTMRRGLTTGRALGIAVIMAALLSYGLGSVLDGNGFVAAFVCGIVYHLFRDTRLREAELAFVEDVALLCNLLVWFAFGLVLDYIFTSAALWSTMTLFAILAVTILRFGPVWLALLGSRYSRAERAMIAGLGPRGTASIVFGLLAWTKLAGEDVDDASLVLIVVAWTVALSIAGFSVAAVSLASRSKESS